MKKEKKEMATKGIVVLDRGIEEKGSLIGLCCFGPIFPIYA